MRWFFSLDDDGTIELRARAEGNGLLGDAREEVKSGESFLGISYEAMRDAGSGTIDVDERGNAKFSPHGG